MKKYLILSFVFLLVIPVAYADNSILQIIKVSFIIRSMQFLKINLEHFGLVPEGDLINSIGNRGILFMFGMTLIIKTGLPIKI